MINEKWIRKLPIWLQPFVLCFDWVISAIAAVSVLCLIMGSPLLIIWLGDQFNTWFYLLFIPYIMIAFPPKNGPCE